MIDVLLDGFCWLFGRPLGWFEDFVMARRPSNPLRRGFLSVTSWWDRREEAGRRAFRMMQAREVAEQDARIDGMLVDDALRNSPPSRKSYH